MKWKAERELYLPVIYLKNESRTVIDQPVRLFLTINVMLSGFRIASPPQLNSKAVAEVGGTRLHRYSVCPRSVLL
ncbi:hypothetical protein A6U92_20410 [Agrobacterium rubi]|nr:hypothetical protein A6U92_20410 [Agrobacterium rubi]